MYKTSFNKFNKKTLIFGFIATVATTGSVIGYHEWKKRLPPTTLSATLPYYGFKSEQQKLALSYLMNRSGIKDADVLLNKEVSNSSELANSILNFVRQTQQNFTIRTGNQERWDVQISDRMKDTSEQPKVLDALKELNMLDAVHPVFKHRDVICILGATKSTMVLRLEYAGNLFAKGDLPANWLVLLAGERYVTSDKNGVSIDGSQEELLDLSAKLGKDSKALTETDLMRSAYIASNLYNKLPTEIIDTPKRDLPRPTTETTVIELCGWLKKHPEIESITFVSNQPHVEYQKAIIVQVFEQQGVKLKIEVVGPAIQVTDNNIESKIKDSVGALGSQIWASTPGVLDALGIDACDPRLSEEFFALFKKQPLIYNNLKNKCKPN